MLLISWAVLSVISVVIIRYCYRLTIKDCDEKIKICEKYVDNEEKGIFSNVPYGWESDWKAKLIYWNGLKHRALRDRSTGTWAAPLFIGTLLFLFMIGF